MVEYNAGELCRSLAGHDKNKIYVIIAADDAYVYLVDGKIKKVDQPKAKKKKHVQLIHAENKALKDKLSINEARNEDIICVLNQYRKNQSI